VKATRWKEKTMRDLKSLFTGITLAVALAFPMAVWAADEDDGNGLPTITFEITHNAGAGWFITVNHKQCSIIPEEFGDINPIDRSPTDPLGDRVTQITTKVRTDGSRQINRFDAVSGIAQDSNGDRYLLTYENHPIYDVPPGDDPVTVRVRMVDRFRLIGNGFNMDFGFDMRWKFQVPSGSAFDPGPEFTGVVFPDDPVNPTNVSNLKVFSAHGVAGCDPL
jgi:hypothetical protein